MRTKKTATSNAPLTADRIAKAILDRLIAVEKQLAVLRKELNEHMEMIAELQPKLTSDGQLKLRAMSEDDKSTTEFEVVANCAIVREL